MSGKLKTKIMLARLQNPLALGYRTWLSLHAAKILLFEPSISTFSSLSNSKNLFQVL